MSLTVALAALALIAAVMWRVGMFDPDESDDVATIDLTRPR